MPSLEPALAAAKYINLRTFKKDGGAVDTPVWFAVHGERLMVFTDGSSYKVKRIRRNASVQVARCDMRGGLQGPWHAGSCRPVENEPELIDKAYDLLNAKYGLLMRGGTFFAKLTGRASRRLILEITLAN